MTEYTPEQFGHDNRTLLATGTLNKNAAKRYAAQIEKFASARNLKVPEYSRNTHLDIRTLQNETTDDIQQIVLGNVPGIGSAIAKRFGLHDILRIRDYLRGYREQLLQIPYVGDARLDAIDDILLQEVGLAFPGQFLRQDRERWKREYTIDLIRRSM